MQLLPSFLTTIFFSLSVIFAARSSRLLGTRTANLGRIVVATFLLGIWAHGVGQGLHGPAFRWFFLSGVIGFGLGDMAMFCALPRIGPRLSILLTQCLAAPLATAMEWLWLGTTLHTSEMICAGVILCGVALALAPDHGREGDRATFWTGVLFGLGSALGQASGAVISRKANLIAAQAHFEIDGGTAAYQRIVGGVLTTALTMLILHRLYRSETPAKAEARRSGWIFVVANALAGPSIGVGCYQWALRKTPSGVVLPIVATSPLMTILLAFLIEGQRPSRRAISGGIIAVAGAAALSWMQSAEH